MASAHRRRPAAAAFGRTAARGRQLSGQEIINIFASGHTQCALPFRLAAATWLKIR
jgi:hypothetical protein